MLRPVLVASIAFSIAACNTAATTPGRGELFASSEEIAAKDDTICRSYGAKPGSDAYVQCRTANAQQRQTQRARQLGFTCNTYGTVTSCL